MNRIRKLKSHVALLALTASVLLSACGRDDPASLIGSARDYQAKGDHNAAIIQLKNVLQKQPENGEARLMLGRSALIVGDAPTAEKEFRKALEYGQPQAIVVPLLADGDAPERRRRRRSSRSSASTKLDDPAANAELQARAGRGASRAPGTASRRPAAFAAALASDPKNVRAQLGQARLKAIDGQDRRSDGGRREDRVRESEVARGADAAVAAEARARRQGRRHRRAQGRRRRVARDAGPAPAADFAADLRQPARRGDRRDRRGAQGARARAAPEVLRGR